MCEYKFCQLSLLLQVDLIIIFFVFSLSLVSIFNRRKHKNSARYIMLKLNIVSLLTIIFFFSRLQSRPNESTSQSSNTCLYFKDIEAWIEDWHLLYYLCNKIDWNKFSWSLKKCWMILFSTWVELVSWDEIS